MVRECTCHNAGSNAFLWQFPAGKRTLPLDRLAGPHLQIPSLRSSPLSADALPAPDPQDQARSDALAQQMQQAIEQAGGWIAFDEWMHRALYTPGLGYYSGPRSPLGAQGDFVTAPELSPLFGQAIASQVAQCLRTIAPQGPWRVLEFGAGSGALAASLLPALAEAGTPADEYAVLEVSGLLRSQQAHTLAQRASTWRDRVHWIDQLPASFTGVILANEVIDALPVRLFERGPDGWQELGVALDPNTNRFALAAREPASSGAVGLPDPACFAPGYRLEIAEQARAWMRSLGQSLSRGVVLLVDYGFPAHELFHPQRSGGTLMAHFRHRAHAGLLDRPGLQDLTAHVDFSALTRAGEQAGLRLAGYTSQARFLLNCGILEQAQHLAVQAPRDPAAVRALGALQTLLSEAEMGELFKVIAFTRGLDASAEPWRGFARGDRSMMLHQKGLQP